MIDPKLIDYFPPEHDGYPEELAKEDTVQALWEACGNAAREFPRSLWIEPRDWLDKASDNDKYKTWGLNYIDRFTNQGDGDGRPGTHECTCHSLRANAEAARNRARSLIYADGPKKDFRYDESSRVGSVWLSPLSVYSEANPRQWGGANVRQVLEIACRRGMLPEKIQPVEYNLKHTLQGTCGKGGMNQSFGPWPALKDFPAGWEETARWFKPLEVIFPGSYEEAMCCLLHGMCVSVGRNGHAVPWARWIPSEKVIAYPDSYDIIRYDSEATAKSAWQGSFAIATMTLPDDWSKPAG